MLTTLCGWESEEDVDVIQHLETRFEKPIVFFRRIADLSAQQDGYWHTRIKDLPGIVFVRKNALGDLLAYGPVESHLINSE